MEIQWLYCELWNYSFQGNHKLTKIEKVERQGGLRSEQKGGYKTYVNTHVFNICSTFH